MGIRKIAEYRDDISCVFAIIDAFIFSKDRYWRRRGRYLHSSLILFSSMMSDNLDSSSSWNEMIFWCNFSIGTILAEVLKAASCSNFTRSLN
ncbi:hypothetical protein PMAYCL1PPCAC_13152 [Pristionchus mayeri]|uniref:Uncharacterized protein n=1 Tax=Pristionchus mayeri TaxID=1317129 RepID=A0AAN4ZR73_9BILA|nr:hypothetical protein PMAYCL1PPCAC_13152 [Pristionchus mayeri]